jgi:hypothetical protein
MSRRAKLSLLALPPGALLAAVIVTAFDLSSLGAAIAVISITFLIMWIFDPPEAGFNRRRRRAKRAA